ncbi:serine/threonine-protein kinase [Pseudonocardia halophobica]|uniref:non-specific serine/threonine protein kinase n=1 Tax=Pseudonocardia halophobica TaxID=29401 RepID=A0A9W6NY95_9PSEU|nr:serine/threonine-protein kinase [Pseudonocardia halophobica]GLL13558.1 serine/threonine protein kinase [Pseudonocardia halophobica]
MQGTTFGPYTIEELLGRGGMGEVYRAFDTDTDREVALKVLPSALAGDAEYTERFRRECRAAARLREPHVVPIHRFGEIDGQLYLDMRLVEGSDLGSWLAAHGPLSPAAAVAVISQIASALDAAHAEGMVHRDVKPSNILLAGVGDEHEVDPGEVFAYLFDFGIASSTAAGEGGEQLTRSGTVPGSVAYLAPERFHGVPADRRVDVYALACVLHQALSGRQPFTGDLPTLMHAHLAVPPPPIGRPDVPSALDEVVARGMAKDPDQRFPTAGALAAAARAALGTSAGPVPTAPPPPTGEPRTSTFGSGPPTPAWSDPRQTPVGPPAPAWSDPRRAPAGMAAGWSSAPDTMVGQGWQAPPPRKRTSRAAVAAVVAGVLIVLGGLATAGVLLVRGAGSTPAPTPTAAPTAPPTAATPQSVAPTVAAGSGDAALFADLPAGFSTSNCTADAGTAGTIGAVSYLECENGPADGPDGGTFTRYDQQSRLDEGFDGAARSANVPLVENGQHSSCKTGTTIATGYSQNDEFAGRVGCYVDAASGAAYLFWADNAALALGYLRRSDGDMTALYDWWSANDFKAPGR